MPLPDRDPDEPDFLAPLTEVLRDEVDALFAADFARPVEPELLFRLDFDAPDLAPDFEAADLEAAVDFDATPRAGEREADFFEAALDFFAAVFEPPFAPVFMPAFMPDFDAAFLLELAPFDAAVFFAPPDLRDLVVLSAITRLLSAFA